MKIIDLLFGWITKPIIQQTPLDELIGTIEIIIVIIILIVLCEWRKSK